MGEIYSASGVRVFHTTVTVWCGQIHNSIIKHTGNSVSFILHAKRMVRFILITSIFYLLLFINIFNWQYFFILQATALGCESSPMKLFVEMHMRSDNRQKMVQQFIDNQAQHFVVRWFWTIFFFLSYYFLEFDDFIFYFQETYNNRLKKRYMDDPSTHPDLWLEAWLYGEPNKNRVYRLSNTMAENLQTTYCISTIRCS
jgi:hypothetical protein